MKFRVFDTEAEAIAAEAQVAQAIGCIKIGTNAKTGGNQSYSMREKQRTRARIIVEP